MTGVHGDPAKYEELHERSLADPAGFWGERAAAMLDWATPWEEVVPGGFGAAAGPVRPAGSPAAP